MMLGKSGRGSIVVIKNTQYKSNRSSALKKKDQPVSEFQVIFSKAAVWPGVQVMHTFIILDRIFLLQLYR
jgi:hypothetical protein